MNTNNHASPPRWVLRYLFALLVIQPFLDVLSYWMNALGRGTGLTMTLRLMILVATILLGWILAENKRVYRILFGILILVAGCHVFACVRASGICGDPYSLGAAVIDLTNYVRVMQMPIFALAMVTILKRTGEDGWRTTERALMVNFFVIFAIEIISAATGTNPYTYPNKSIGLLGWFYFANSQSAILSMLVPMVICTAMKTGSLLKTAVVSGIGFLMLWLFATRLAYLAIFIIGFGTLIVWAVNRKLDKRIAVWLLVLTIACGASYPISPMTKNRQLMAANEAKKQEKIDRLIAKGQEEFGKDGYEYLTYAYEEFIGHTVHKFGLEKVARLYHNAATVSQISNLRLERINYNLLLLSELPATSRWFGINFNDMVFEGATFDVENDFHGILFLYGYLGLFCFALFFLYFFYLIAAALLKDFKKYFTVEAGACGIALCGGLLHAYATAGVLRRPNATVYLSLILAMIWYLVRQKQYPDIKEVTE